MTSLKQTAQAYEPKKTKNITELPSVDINEPMEERSGTGNDGKDFSYSVLIRDGEEYRVPGSVLEAIQNLIENMEDLKVVKVTKKGEGMNTKYTVIPVTNSTAKVA